MMRKTIFLVFFSLTLTGCVNTHPYKYTLNENIKNQDKFATIWAVEDITNDDGISLSIEKRSHLTNSVIAYLTKKGFNAVPLSQTAPQGSATTLTVHPKVINAWAEISQNTAGWHGAKESALGFWSHFYLGNTGPLITEGSIAALSLQIQIFNGDALYLDNAGGIELEAKVHRFAGTETKTEVLSNDKKFVKAMDIAFKPLLEAL